MAPDVFVCSLNSFQPIWNTSWQFAWHKSEILLVAGSRSHPIDDDPQLASLSRVLDLRREGPMISSILSSISPFSPSRNSCRMHHDLRRFFGSRLLHTEDGGLQLHEKIPKFPPLSGSVFWGQHPSQRPGKPCPTPTDYISKSLHYLQDNTTSTSPQWIRKSIRSWLLYFFRSTTMWHFETWVWGWARPGPVPYPLEVQK